MRNVLQSDEIAQAWVNRTQPSARCAANMRFDGPRFYSYSTAVAAMIEHDGKTVFLVTDKFFSVTTSTHIGIVRCAIPKGSQVFAVPVAGASITDLARSLAAWWIQVNGLLEASPKAREPKKTRLLIEAYQTVLVMREFAAFFGLSLDEYRVPPLFEKSIVPIMHQRERETLKRTRERRERAQLAETMRDVVPRLIPGKVVTARDVYQAWEASQAVNS